MKDCNTPRPTVPRLVSPMLLAAAVPGVAMAQEADYQEDVGPGDEGMYEEDAWYDVTEWFDGNDYNPTNEKIAVWDDESYRTRDGWYGYDEAGTEDDDWYYDWQGGVHHAYPESPDTGVYGWTSTYYDYDGDGYYEAYSSYYDQDADGTFESGRFVSVGDVSQQDRQEAEKESGRKPATKATSHTGKIADAKEVSVRDRTHQVVRLETDGGKKVVVDLGAKSELSGLELSSGKRLTVRGPVVPVGEHEVLFAERVELDGRTMTIDRNPVRLEGEVLDQRNLSVDGREHVLAVLRTKGAGAEPRTWLVDLGPADQVAQRVSKGQTIQVRGIPCEKDGRHVLLARSATLDGQQMGIDRRGRMEGRPMEAGAPRSGGERKEQDGRQDR